MPAFFTHQDLQQIKGVTQPHSRLATHLFVEAIAYCEDVLHNPNGLLLAQLTELGPPRHASAAVSSLLSARLVEIRDGFVRIPDFARYSGVGMLELLKQQERRRRRRRASAVANEARWDGKDQLSLISDAIAIRSASDPPQTPPGNNNGLNPVAVAAGKKS